MKTTQAGSNDRYSRNEAEHNDDFFAGLSSEALEELSRAWRKLTTDDLKRMVDLAQE